jgi:hypothetical protein
MASGETPLWVRKHILLYKRTEILTVIIGIIIIVCVLWSGTDTIVIEQRKQIVAGTVLFCSLMVHVEVWWLLNEHYVEKYILDVYTDPV